MCASLVLFHAMSLLTVREVKQLFACLAGDPLQEWNILEYFYAHKHLRRGDTLSHLSKIVHKEIVRDPSSFKDKVKKWAK